MVDVGTLFLGAVAEGVKESLVIDFGAGFVLIRLAVGVLDRGDSFGEVGLREWQARNRGLRAGVGLGRRQRRRSKNERKKQHDGREAAVNERSLKASERFNVDNERMEWNEVFS